MQKYTIEIEDTISDTLKFIAETLNKPIEVVIADGVFNQISGLNNIMLKIFSVADDYEDKDEISQ